MLSDFERGYGIDEACRDDRNKLQTRTNTEPGAIATGTSAPKAQLQLSTIKPEWYFKGLTAAINE
jgi:hypothetical protein